MDTATTARIATQRLPVVVLLASGAEVRGDVHVKPDGYQGRVSDLLNRGPNEFIPVTDATLVRPDGTTLTTDCLILGREQIELVVCEPAPDTPEGLEDAQQAVTTGFGARAAW